MKTKSILSMLILIAFAILGGGSIEGVNNIDSGIKWALLIGLIVLIVIIVMLYINFSSSQDEIEKKRKLKEEELEREEQERLLEIENKYLEQRKSLISKYGFPDRRIKMEENNINSEIHVYEDLKKVLIFGKEYMFSEILSCTYSDNATTIKGKVSAKTKSDLKNVVGRSLVGGVLAGDVGAIIGGTTARNTTEIIQEDDKIIHDYMIIINVDRISNPIIHIHTGENKDLTSEIVGLMNVIASRK